VSKPAVTKIFILGLLLLLPGGMTLAADSKTKDTKTTESKVSDNKLAKADADFIKEADLGGLMEVELGKLAQDKAANEKVKEFGKRMEQDHSKVNSELKKLASDKGVQLATDLDKKHKSKVDKLAKLSGADFDKKYMQDMISGHKDDIKKFQRESDKAKDSDVKKFAGQSLPTLKEHLQLAESAAQDVKSAGKSPGKTASR
jgi:putative membrane protein